MKIAVFEPYPCTGYQMPLDKYWEGPENTHGGRGIETIKYWVNKYASEYNNRLDAYLLPRNATALNWAKANGVMICNLSVDDWLHHNEMLIKYELMLHKQALLVTSAGNEYKDGETPVAQREPWLAVGSVDSNYTPRPYTSWKYGKVVCCGIDGINGNFGTSFASPYVVALAFIYYEKYFDAMGYYPSPKQALQWIKFNSHDVYTDGWDLKTGYGVLRLPRRWEFEDVAIKIDDKDSMVIRQYIDGVMTEKQFDLEIESTIVNDRLFLSFREMGKVIGGAVHYDEENRTAYIGR